MTVESRLEVGVDGWLDAAILASDGTRSAGHRLKGGEGSGRLKRGKGESLRVGLVTVRLLDTLLGGCDR
jgi:hypothetical protein